MTDKLLTEQACREASPKSMLYELEDGDGLWLRVHNDGKKDWVCRYTLDGNAGTYQIGDYPAISLEAARIDADTASTLAVLDIDPSACTREEWDEARSTVCLMVEEAEETANDQPTCEGMNAGLAALRKGPVAQMLAEDWGIDAALAAEFARRPTSPELQAKQARLLQVLQANAKGKASPNKK